MIYFSATPATDLCESGRRQSANSSVLFHSVRSTGSNNCVLLSYCPLRHPGSLLPPRSDSAPSWPALKPEMAVRLRGATKTALRLDGRSYSQHPHRTGLSAQVCGRELCFKRPGRQLPINMAIRLLVPSFFFLVSYCV